MTTNRLTPRILIPVLLCLGLAACGWQLRGTSMIPANITSLYVARDDGEDSLLVRQLQQTLNSADIATPATSDNAQYALLILSENFRKRTATVNANARVSEQELTEEVRFTVRDQEGEIAIPPSIVSVERVFEYDETNVVATRDEEQLIRDEMRRDLVGQILNRLRQLHNVADATAP